MHDTGDKFMHWYHFSFLHFLIIGPAFLSVLYTLQSWKNTWVPKQTPALCTPVSWVVCWKLSLWTVSATLNPQHNMFHTQHVYGFVLHNLHFRERVSGFNKFTKHLIGVSLSWLWNRVKLMLRRCHRRVSKQTFSFFFTVSEMFNCWKPLKTSFWGETVKSTQTRIQNQETEEKYHFLHRGRQNWY